MASLAVDIGGTFTDVVASVAGKTYCAKVPTTPGDLCIGVMDGVRATLAVADTDPRAVAVLIHATTVASNALFEKTGATVALIVTDGFGDILEIGRQRRADPYDLERPKLPALVPRTHVFEVKQRRDHNGKTLVAIDDLQVAELGTQLTNLGVEAVAVSFLHSYANGDDELQVVETLRRSLDSRVRLFASHQVVREAREYERTSTTVIAAYLSRVVGSYLARLSVLLKDFGCPNDFWIMKSSGGLSTASVAVQHPEELVESGPAAGATGAARVAKDIGLMNVLSFDMGGTTAKVSVILDGEPALSFDYEVGGAVNSGAFLKRGTGYPLRAPVVDLAEVGTGGGSIAWLDEGGALRVGPRGAGSQPGPACYGRGGQQPTITDADVVLGYVGPTMGSLHRDSLKPSLARAAIENQIARPLRRSVEDAALGIEELAHAQMANAVRLVTLAKGLDPRDFTLIAFGGAGPVHAWAVAMELGIRRILIPPLPGVFSAVSLLAANFRIDVSRGGRWSLRDERASNALQTIWRELADTANGVLTSEGHSSDSIQVSLAADIRYVGQSYEVQVPVPNTTEPRIDLDKLAESFHAAHLLTYGHNSLAEPVEVIVARAAAFVPNTARTLSKPPQRRVVTTSHREIWFGPGSHVSRVVERDAVSSGSTGPIAIEQLDTTTLVPPGAVVTTLDGDFLSIELAV